MSALKIWVRRALLAALISFPVPAIAEIAARLDVETGAVTLTGLGSDEREDLLANPDLLRCLLYTSDAADD